MIPGCVAQCLLIRSDFPRAAAPWDPQKLLWVAGGNQCPSIAPDTNLALNLAALPLPPPPSAQNRGSHTLRGIGSPFLLYILCMCPLEAACPRAVPMCLELQLFYLHQPSTAVLSAG